MKLRRGEGATVVKVVALLLACLAGCGSSVDHTVSAKNYDRSCADVVDCFAIYEGQLGCCGLSVTCPNTAISTDALARYMSDAARASMCSVQPPCPSGGGCTGGRVACTSGVCALLFPSDAGAARD